MGVGGWVPLGGCRWLGGGRAAAGECSIVAVRCRCRPELRTNFGAQGSDVDGNLRWSDPRTRPGRVDTISQ